MKKHEVMSAILKGNPGSDLPLNQHRSPDLNGRSEQFINRELILAPTSIVQVLDGRIRQREPSAAKASLSL